MTFRRTTVRRAAPGDAPTLRTLRLEALAEAPEAFASTYHRELARTTPDWQRSVVGFGSRDQQRFVLKVIKCPGDEWYSGQVLEAFAGRRHMPAGTRPPTPGPAEWRATG